MRINHNISALKANNQLSRTNNLLDASLEKLSSGFRINSAADDSAGLAISEKMRTQISGLEQASRNASDGISVIQTAEGALVEVESMLQRMRELAVQSANGTYTTQDRTAIQAEIDQLNEEIKRISDTTEFNTMTLLDGNIDRKSYSSDNRVSLVSLSDTVSIGDYGVKITQDARQAVIVGNATGFTGPTTERKITEDEAGSINVNGESILVYEGETIDEVFEKIRDACDNVDVNIFAVNTADLTADPPATTPKQPSATENLDMAGYESKPLEGGNTLVFMSREYGSEEKINIYCDSPDLCKLLGLTIKGASAEGFDAKAELVLKSDDANSLFENTTTLSVKGSKITVSDSNDFKMVFEVEPGTVGSTFTDATITDSDAEMLPSYPPNTIIAGDYGVTITQDARQAVVVGNVTRVSATDPQPTDLSGNITSDQEGIITINSSATPLDINITDTATVQEAFDAFKAALALENIKVYAIKADAKPSATGDLDQAGYTSLSDTTFTAGDRLLFVSDEYGDSAEIDIECSTNGLGELFGLTTKGASANGSDAKVEIAANSPGLKSVIIQPTVDVAGNHITITDEKGVVTEEDATPGMVETEFTDALITATNVDITKGSIMPPCVNIVVSVLDAGPMDLQIGANEGQTMSVRIPKVTPQTLGVDKVNIGTADGAQEAIGLLDIAINQVSAIRSKLGAYQNRLEHSISNLDVTSENMTESLSRIEDVDMAEEMAEYTQKNVLAQAGTSMLAQANQRPQQILSLIQQ